MIASAANGADPAGLAARSIRPPPTRSTSVATLPRRRSRTAGWKKIDNAWRRAGDTKPLTFELLSPDAASNPGLYAAAAAVAADWKYIGIQVTHVPLPPASS